MFGFQDITSDFEKLEVGIFALLLLLGFLEALLFLFDEFLVVGVGADESHEALVEGVGLYLLAAEGALIEFELQVLLDLSLGRVFEEAILANVVAAGEENHGLTVGGNHQIETNAADVGLYFVSDLFVELLRILLVVFVGGVAHLLDEVDRVVLHSILNIHLLTDLLLLSLLVPNPPLLLVQPSLLVFHPSKL